MILNCHNCRLRPWHTSDKAALLKHANNYKIWQNLRDRFPHPYTHADADWWLQHAGQQQPLSLFAIEVNGEAAGSIGLDLQQDVERTSAELGYWLGEAYWGKGIATAAIRAITTWAMPALGLSRIYALPFIHNQGSVRALEKAGYLREGVLRRSAIKEGKILDQALYAFTDLDLAQKN
ncbi:GNAT family N-acetyltransferase [Cesiribacter sp. SM1]|uniref:GNAT family N-acetyltransferase n=1 Tax=Cesiribacter sp. SM1 TaxID=2861196 RepID=UPI001CD5ACB8|nr:GNAT family protein [Cesiribacter sp. SM1]